MKTYLSVKNSSNTVSVSVWSFKVIMCACEVYRLALLADIKIHFIYLERKKKISYSEASEKTFSV